MGPLALPPPQPADAAKPSPSTAMIITRRRLPSGKPSSATPRHQQTSGQWPSACSDWQRVGWRQASVIDPAAQHHRMRCRDSVDRKVTEPPAGIEMGVVKVNVVLAEGEVTVTDCPAPLRVIVLNRPG